MEHVASSFVSVRAASVMYQEVPTLWSKLTNHVPVSHRALTDVSFELASGDQVVVYGAAGAGKSTLLRLLTGVLAPTSGRVIVNGARPEQNPHTAAGYVSRDEGEPPRETAYEVLYRFATAHGVTQVATRISDLADQVGITGVLQRRAEALSTTERLRLNVARAVLSRAPLVLLDDVADELGVTVMRQLLEVLAGRTVIVATRFATTAEALDLPVVLLHEGRLAQVGTRDEIAMRVGCQRVIDVWVEGLRYDLLRTLKQHRGVVSVQLLPTSRFVGQRVRITLRSSRYLPSIYDELSQVPLVRVEELPPSLHDIVRCL